MRTYYYESWVGYDSSTEPGGVKASSMLYKYKGHSDNYYKTEYFSKSCHPSVAMLLHYGPDDPPLTYQLKK